MTNEPEIHIISITPTHPQEFGGHVFELTHEDVFRCIHCGGYEIVLRDPDTGAIPECPGAKEA